MKTRSKPAAKEAAAAAVSAPLKTLPEGDANPPKLLIVPEEIQADASIVTLAHPRSAAPTRYYFCPTTGLYEIKKISAEQTLQRSWLLTGAPEDKDSLASTSECNEEAIKATGNTAISIAQGYIAKAPEICTSTKIDPLFLVLPAISPTPKSTKSDSVGELFLSAEDLLDTIIPTSKHLAHLSRHPTTRQLLESRLQAVCDTVDAGDEKMYRLNMTKLLQELVRKARSVIKSGFPASMEDKFVKKLMEPPMMAVKRQDTTSNSDAEENVNATISETEESQNSTGTPGTLESQSSASTTLTVPDEHTENKPSKELMDLLRLRTAVSYIMLAYLPAHLTKALNELLFSEKCEIDFKPLDEHLAHIAKLKAEAVASRSVGDFSRKRAAEDDEAAEERAEKKRKKEEEDKKKKASESRGLRDLKKADTTGMKKMSDFFKKAPQKKK